MHSGINGTELGMTGPPNAFRPHFRRDGIASVLEARADLPHRDTSMSAQVRGGTPYVRQQHLVGSGGPRAGNDHDAASRRGPSATVRSNTIRPYTEMTAKLPTALARDEP